MRHTFLNGFSNWICCCRLYIRRLSLLINAYLKWGYLIISVLCEFGVDKRLQRRRQRFYCQLLKDFLLFQFNFTSTWIHLFYTKRQNLLRNYLGLWEAGKYIFRNCSDSHELIMKNLSTSNVSKQSPYSSLKEWISICHPEFWYDTVNRYRNFRSTIRHGYDFTSKRS